MSNGGGNNVTCAVVAGIMTHGEGNNVTCGVGIMSHGEWE